MPSLFEEVPPWARPAIALTIAAQLAAIVASMHKKQNAESFCHIAAVEWEGENQNGAAFKAVDKTHFKKQYVLFREACPNGHGIVNERTIPAEVKAAYVPIAK